MGDLPQLELQKTEMKSDCEGRLDCPANSWLMLNQTHSIQIAYVHRNGLLAGATSLANPIAYDGSVFLSRESPLQLRNRQQKMRPTLNGQIRM